MARSPRCRRRWRPSPPPELDHPVVHGVVRVDVPAEDVGVEACGAAPGFVRLDLPVHDPRPRRLLRLLGGGAPRSGGLLAAAAGFLARRSRRPWRPSSRAWRASSRLLVADMASLVTARTHASRLRPCRPSLPVPAPRSPRCSARRSACTSCGLSGRVQQGAEVDRLAEDDVDGAARCPARPGATCFDEVVEQPVHEDRDDRHARLADDAPHAALRGQERVRDRRPSCACPRGGCPRRSRRGGAAPPSRRGSRG